MGNCQGHHPSLCERVSDFTNALQQDNPPVPGLDKSIVISPRRLHLTLGVMSLESNASQVTNIAAAEANASSAVLQTRPKTLQSALSILTELRPRILDILGGQKLRVALNRMDIMQPERGDRDKAHVLWLGSRLDDEDGMRLKDVCSMFVFAESLFLFYLIDGCVALVNRTFLDAGLVVDERRPLKVYHLPQC